MFVISTCINMFIDKKRDDTNFDPVYKRIYTRGLGLSSLLYPVFSAVLKWFT